MVPTKAKDLLPEMVEKVGIPEDDYSAMISFYFKENRAILSNLDHLHVVFRGLGTMMLKGWDIEEELTNHRKKLEMASNQITIDTLQKNLTRLEKIKEKWDSDRARKKEIGEKKKKYYEIKNSENESQG